MLILILSSFDLTVPYWHCLVSPTIYYLLLCLPLLYILSIAKWAALEHCTNKIAFPYELELIVFCIFIHIDTN